MKFSRKAAFAIQQPESPEKQPKDVGLVRVLGLIILLPILSTLAAPDSRHIGAAALGLLAVGAYLLALAPSTPTRPPLLVPGLCASVLACGVAAHLLAGQSWVMVATAAALLCAVRLPLLPVALAGITCCTAVALGMGLMQDTTTTVLVVAGPGALAALRHRLLVSIAELESAREQLAVAAVREERERFSDDLHDVLGHSLSVIVVAAQVVQRTAATRPEEVREAGRQIESVGRKALNDVRAVVLNYRTASLRDEADELRQALHTAGIEAQFETAPDLPSGLPANAEPMLALVLREAVTNVIRHSNASQCEVTIRTETSRVTLDVVDNGRGSNDEAAHANSGLATVRSRLAQLGGELQVTTVEPRGLRLSVAIPCPSDGLSR